MSLRSLRLYASGTCIDRFQFLDGCQASRNIRLCQFVRGKVDNSKFIKKEKMRCLAIKEFFSLLKAIDDLLVSKFFFVIFAYFYINVFFKIFTLNATRLQQYGIWKHRLNLVLRPPLLPGKSGGLQQVA